VPSFVQISPGLEHGLLAEALAKRLGPELSRTCLVNSGSEAVEGALKLAYAATRRASVLHCEKSYHGVTLGALSVMGSERMRAPFPSIPGSEMVPFGDLESVERRLKTKKYAAFIVEPIQFEAGIRLTKTSYFVEVALLCKKYGTLLVFDEAQTGIGRTGALFAHQWMGVTPDVVCYAKALSGGLVPIGGYSTSPDWQRRAYGRLEDCDLVASTFGGGALACTVARRTLELVDEPLLRHVRSMGEHLDKRLAAVKAATDTIADVRGKGMLWAIEFAPPTKGLSRLLTLGIPNLVARRLFAHWVAMRMLEKGFLTQTPSHDQNVLRVEPAFVMQPDEIDRFCDALKETVGENERFVKFVRDAGGRLLSRQLKTPS
jgi:putrescine aminotransferase